MVLGFSVNDSLVLHTPIFFLKAVLPYRAKFRTFVEVMERDNNLLFNVALSPYFGGVKTFP
jgi:hypothetical protein